MVLRIRILALAFLIATFGLIVRLFFWQIVKGEDLSLQARLQHTSSQEVFAQRGSILAADGSWLSASTDAWLLYVSKPEIDQTHRAIANTLAPLLIEAKANKKELAGFEPETRISPEKLRRLNRVIQTYLASKKYPEDQDWQIDVVALTLDKDRGVAKIKHFKNIEM